MERGVIMSVSTSTQDAQLKKIADILQNELELFRNGTKEQSQEVARRVLIEAGITDIHGNCIPPFARKANV